MIYIDPPYNTGVEKLLELAGDEKKAKVTLTLLGLLVYIQDYILHMEHTLIFVYLIKITMKLQILKKLQG